MSNQINSEASMNPEVISQRSFMWSHLMWTAYKSQSNYLLSAINGKK